MNRKQSSVSARHSVVGSPHPVPNPTDDTALTSKDDSTAGKLSGRKESTAMVSARKASTLHGTDPAHPTAPVVHSVSNTAALQQQLIDSYTLREKMNSAELDASLAQKGDMKNAYRTLYDKYKCVAMFIAFVLKATSSLFVKMSFAKFKFYNLC